MTRTMDELESQTAPDVLRPRTLNLFILRSVPLKTHHVCYCSIAGGKYGDTITLSKTEICNTCANKNVTAVCSRGTMKPSALLCVAGLHRRHVSGLTLKTVSQPTIPSQKLTILRPSKPAYEPSRTTWCFKNALDIVF